MHMSVTNLAEWTKLTSMLEPKDNTGKTENKTLCSSARL